REKSRSPKTLGSRNGEAASSPSLPRRRLPCFMKPPPFGLFDIWWVSGTRLYACGKFLGWCCLFHPISLVLAQRNGVEPQRKTPLGWWRPREVSGPTRLSHSRGRCHSAAKVSASRTDFITRPRARGLGWWRIGV